MHRPPSPARHRVNFPRLSLCPHCGLDLRELPPSGHCPRCLFEYDERAWSIPVRFPASRDSLAREALRTFGIHGTIASIILFLLSAWLWHICFGIIFLFVPLFWLGGGRRRPHGALICSPDGLTIRAGRRRRARTIPWQQVREIDIADAEFAATSNEALTLVIRALRDGPAPALAEVVAIDNTCGLGRHVYDTLLHEFERRR